MATIKYNIKTITGFCAVIFLLVAFWGIFVPYSLSSKPEVAYMVQKGMDYKTIGVALQKQGIIKNHGFFWLYVLGSFNYRNLQAGNYSLSPSMSVEQIVKKMTTGDVIKNNITIIEGWDLQDIGTYLESKNTVSKQDFLDAANPPSHKATDGQGKDFTADFDFLKDKPKKLNLEGYIFPDTYDVPLDATGAVLVKLTLANFDKKLTPDLQKEITRQKKSIFQIITMASLIEKEVQTKEDKKIVSGILWKRIKAGVALQVDATINYITGNNAKSITTKDTKIDSPYNTYKYPGLPLGPIANPGMDSILAAIYPKDSPYWYYLSATKTGETIFSKTLDEHNQAVQKYLK